MKKKIEFKNLWIKTILKTFYAETQSNVNIPKLINSKMFLKCY